MTKEYKQPNFSFINFEANDFGEPSHETLSTLMHQIEHLKKLSEAAGHVDTVRLDDDPNPEVPQIDGTLTHYDITIPRQRESTAESSDRIHASLIATSNPSTMVQIQQELAQAHIPLVSVNVKRNLKSFEYTQYYGQEASLYIYDDALHVEREPSSHGTIEEMFGSVGVSIQGDPEFMRYMHRRLEDRAEAKQQGLTKPTEGTMRELTEAIDSILGKYKKTVAK